MREGLEQLTETLQQGVSVEAEALFSTAVSLKRIADVLTELAVLAKATAND